MDRGGGSRVVALSRHARMRCQQRGVRWEDVEVALRAKPTWNGGDLVYCVTDRLLLRLGLPHRADRLRGLTVVVTPHGVVRTVKWDEEKRKRGLLRRSRSRNRAA